MAEIVRRDFPVKGMGCSACVARVEGVIKNLPGVKGCDVSLLSASAAVSYDPKAVTAADIQKAVRDAGYDLIVTGDE